MAVTQSHMMLAPMLALVKLTMAPVKLAMALVKLTMALVKLALASVKLAPVKLAPMLVRETHRHLTLLRLLTRVVPMRALAHLMRLAAVPQVQAASRSSGLLASSRK